MVNAIRSALKSIASSLSDAAQQMQHDGEFGIVLSTSSRELSDDSVSADAPSEVCRVVGSRADFPTVTRGVTVRLEGATRIVTSARTDPIGASVSIGLSDVMDEIVATYRRQGTQMRAPVRLLAVESETPMDAWADAVAPTTCSTWFCCLSREDWTEDGEPQIGDELAWDAERVRVATVAKHGGYWILTCRARR